MSDELTRLRRRASCQDRLEASRKLLARNLARECERLIANRAVQPIGEIRDYSEETTNGDEDRAEHCIWMCRMINSRFEEWSSTRMHRWLGYVQGIMRARGWATVVEMRDMVRRCRQSHTEDESDLT